MSPAWSGLLITLSVAIVPAVLSLAALERVLGLRHPVFMKKSWRAFHAGALATCAFGALQIATTGRFSCGLEGPDRSEEWIALWIFGVALFAAREIWRITRSATIDAEPWSEEIAALSEASERLGLKGRIEVFVSANMRSPFVTGSLRPKLVLPVEFLSMPESLQRAVLCHELSHLQDHDLLWDRIEAISGVLFFFHPFVSWAARLSHRAVERSADRRAVCDGAVRASDLAKALLRLAGAAPAAGRAWSRGSRDLRDRLRALEVGGRGLAPGPAVLAAIFAASLVPVAGASAWSTPEARESAFCPAVSGKDFVREILNSSEPERPYSRK